MAHEPQTPHTQIHRSQLKPHARAVLHVMLHMDVLSSTCPPDKHTMVRTRHNDSNRSSEAGLPLAEASSLKPLARSALTTRNTASGRRRAQGAGRSRPERVNRPWCAHLWLFRAAPVRPPLPYLPPPCHQSLPLVAPSDNSAKVAHKRRARGPTQHRPPAADVAPRRVLRGRMVVAPGAARPRNGPQGRHRDGLTGVLGWIRVPQWTACQCT